ncbi:hypothetical protein Tco_1361645 [Tanacetum coccineum]
MTIEEAQAQMKEIKRLELLKAEKEKSKKRLKEDIIVDRMHRNLVPPLGVVGSLGLVIREPESGIFSYNRNFDLVFQREEEFHLETMAQLIKIQSSIKRDTPEEKKYTRRWNLL